jgi:hypothetical protein
VKELEFDNISFVWCGSNKKGSNYTLAARCEGIKFYPCMHASPAFGFCSITSVSLKGEFVVVPTDKICGRSLSSKILESGIKHHNPNL